MLLLVATFYPRSASYKQAVAAHDGAWFVGALSSTGSETAAVAAR